MDLALEDVIAAGKDGRRKGKGGDGRGKASKPDRGQPDRAKKEEAQDGDTSAKLGMALEDVIAKEVRPKGKGKGKAKSKGRGSDDSEWRSKKGSKGHGKSSSVKRQEWTEPKKAWQLAGRKIWSGAKPKKDREASQNDKSWGTRSTGDDEREACMVYVGGCPNSITEQQISKVFSKHGPVREITIKCTARDAYAFVVYSKESHAHAAINARHQTKLFGAMVKVVARKGYTGRRKGDSDHAAKGAGKGYTPREGKGYRDRRADWTDDYQPPSHKTPDAQKAENLEAENARLARELAQLRRTATQEDWKDSDRGSSWDWSGGSGASWRSSAGASHREREGEAWGSRGAWSGGRGPAKERWAEAPSRRGSDWEAPERGAGQERGTKRAREYDYPAREPRTGGRKRIKVSNLPRGLGWRDIKDSFEREAGKISRCEVEGNQAWISFVHSEDAEKAKETFDGGELNGRTITVTLEA